MAFFLRYNGFSWMNCFPLHSGVLSCTCISNISLHIYWDLIQFYWIIYLSSILHKLICSVFCHPPLKSHFRGEYIIYWILAWYFIPFQVYFFLVIGTYQLSRVLFTSECLPFFSLWNNKILNLHCLSAECSHFWVFKEGYHRRRPTIHYSFNINMPSWSPVWFSFQFPNYYLLLLFPVHGKIFSS